MTKLEKLAFKKFLERVKKRPPPKLDGMVQGIHNQVFKKIDCLDCANCCKTTSPIFYPKDIERAAKYLKIKAAAFENDFLRVDEEKDFVLQGSPCVFLDLDDNKCSIYDARPNACRTYPHTDRKNFYQLTELTFKNLDICPAVVKIVEGMMNAIQ
jgi:uncharacterized protein